MNNNDLVIANNLAYKINNNKLFSNVSFKLQGGESLHINGPNGCGKSTLIRIILGVTKPNKGDVRISKDNRICYLGHKNALKEYLSVEDNISLLSHTAPFSVLPIFTPDANVISGVVKP